MIKISKYLISNIYNIKRTLLNNQIRASNVRVVDETGKQLGVMILKEALRLAWGRNLDLIQITEKVDPPVCKIIDHGKYRYQQEKKEKTQKKQQKAGQIKEIRITPRISDHDLETKAHKIEKFLKKGYKVRINVMLRGREKTLQDFAKARLQNLLKIIQESFKIEQEIKRSPRGLNIIIIRE